MHRIMNVPYRTNPTTRFLSPRAAYVLNEAPLLALGAVDEQGRPWTTIWGGKHGFAGPVGESVIGINSTVDGEYDPVLEALLGDTSEDKVVEYKKKGPIMAGLSINLEIRKRVKLYGSMKVGRVDWKGSSPRAQLLMDIEGSIMNCPKYLNEKYIVPATPTPKLLSNSLQLPPEAVTLVEKADLFFISSSHGTEDMDTNHRGGPTGFVRILSNDATGAVIVYPEYSGNRLYQTLGNLQETPLAGLVFPDFDTGDVLYMTGKTNILVGEDASSILPRCKLAVQITVTSARFVEKGLPFRGIAGEPSPYNPPVRYARGEMNHEEVDSKQGDSQHAVLINAERITPTIKRFRFRVEGAPQFKGWKAGQYATLSFADHLDQGWSHMRDEDPQSLNDDYLRTFTVSSPPSQEAIRNAEFELTIRNVGKATGFLFRQRTDGTFSLPLRGFGGEFRFSNDSHHIAFITAGIGITPLLGQLSSITKENANELHIFWSVRMEDIGLVSAIFAQYPQLIPSTKLFLTGNKSSLNGSLQDKKTFTYVLQSGVHMERRRLEASDLFVLADGTEAEWHMCVGPSMKSKVLNWLAGKRVISEDFNY